jgi:hypothetical protein
MRRCEQTDQHDDDDVGLDSTYYDSGVTRLRYEPAG